MSEALGQEAVQEISVDIIVAEHDYRAHRGSAMFGALFDVIGAPFGMIAAAEVYDLGLSELFPKIVEYPTIAVGGIAAMIAMDKLADMRLAQETKAMIANKRVINQLRQRRSRLQSWIRGPQELDLKDEYTVRQFATQMMHSDNLAQHTGPKTNLGLRGLASRARHQK